MKHPIRITSAGRTTSHPFLIRRQHGMPTVRAMLEAYYSSYSGLKWIATPIKQGGNNE